MPLQNFDLYLSFAHFEGFVYKNGQMGTVRNHARGICRQCGRRCHSIRTM